MARPVLSICSGVHFVEAGGRRFESVRGLGALGVAAEHQYYAGLQDGRLSRNVTLLGGLAFKLAEQHGLDSIVTFAADGFDGHIDHMATYLAGRYAELPHYVRSASATDYAFEGDPQMKMAAMAEHASQYDLAAPDFWNGMDLYRDQLGVEYYQPV